MTFQSLMAHAPRPGAPLRRIDPARLSPAVRSGPADAAPVRPRLVPRRSLGGLASWRRELNRLVAASVLAGLHLLGIPNGVADQKLVRISADRVGEATEFQIENLQTAPITVTLELTLLNLASSVALPYTETIPPRGKVRALQVEVIDRSKESAWEYTYHATWGKLGVEHDDHGTYLLPYPPGESYPVSQGFHGKHSHTGGDCFSIDFKMPEGTAVHAARGGVVAGVKDDSARGGPEKRYEWDANYILIEHSDGTFGHYVHLQKGGSRVRAGQVVQAGDWIGLSGNTGFSTGPHLHFAVFKALSGRQRETFPVRFRIAPLLAVVLAEGKSYLAY